MTYEDQLGGLAQRIQQVSEEIDKALAQGDASIHARVDSIAESFTQLEAAVSNHMSNTFNIVNEATDAIRSHAKRLQTLEEQMRGKQCP